MVAPLAFISATSTVLLLVLGVVGVVLLVLYLKERDRHVERTLRQEQMEAMFVQAHVALALVGRKNEVLECNQAFAALFGRDAASLRNEPLPALVHADERAAWVSQMAHAAVQRQSEVEGEHRYIRADGAAFRARFHLVRATNARGKHLFSTVTLEDVTRQRHVEQALRTSEEKHRNLFEHAADAMLIIDPHSQQVIDANQQACTIYGLGHDAFVGTSLDALRYGDVPTAAPGGEGTYVALHRRADGAPMHILVNASLIPYGHAEAVLSIHRDVSSIKEAEARLRESEHRYRRLVEVSPEPIMLCVDGIVQYANTAAGALLGRDDLTGCPVVSLLAPAFQQEWTRVHAGAVSLQMEAQAHRADGSLIDVEVLAETVPFGAHEAVHTIWRDNRARKQYERELVSAKESAEHRVRLRNGLFERLSHDLRTPVSSILGFARILEDEVPAPAQEFVGYIRNSAFQLMHALNSMVDVSKLEDGAPALHLELLDVGDVVDDVVAAYRPMAHAKNMLMAVEMAPGACVAHFDRSALQRVFTNLVSNALKFNDGGCVTINATTEADGLRLFVCESGAGLTDVVLPDIDEALEQTLGTTHHRVRLDLALARRLVELHGGEISVQTQPGSGTAFCLFFGRDSLPFTAPQRERALEDDMLDELVVAHRLAA